MATSLSLQTTGTSSTIDLHNLLHSGKNILIASVVNALFDYLVICAANNSLV